MQRSLARKTKDSKNYEKQRRRLAKVHAKIANQRKDYLQKLTTTLIRENQTICVEELDIQAMLADKSASQHIASASWRMFRDMLTYKAAWYGNELKLATPSLISRSICPHCGYKSSGNTDRLTSMRMCPNCKKFFDADQRVASKILLNAL
jgi:putative transposase